MPCFSISLYVCMLSSTIHACIISQEHTNERFSTIVYRFSAFATCILVRSSHLLDTNLRFFVTLEIFMFLMYPCDNRIVVSTQVYDFNDQLLVRIFLGGSYTRPFNPSIVWTIKCCIVYDSSSVDPFSRDQEYARALARSFIFVDRYLLFQC